MKRSRIKSLTLMAFVVLGVSLSIFYKASQVSENFSTTKNSLSSFVIK